MVAAVFTKDGTPDGEPVELVKGESRSWLARLARWLGHVWRLVTGQAAAESDVGKDLSNWYFVHSILNLLPDSNLELTYRRGADAEKTVTLEPAYSDQFFQHFGRRTAARDDLLQVIHG